MEDLVCGTHRPSTDALRTTAPARAMLVLLWLMVGVPLFWGVFKALQDVQYLFE
jgi:hypothetical protein